MFITKFFLFFVICSLADCQNFTSKTAGNNDNNLNTVSDDVVRETQNEDDSYLVKMSRSGCFGSCPVYNLIIQPDGKVDFEGIKFTKVVGKSENKLDSDKLKLLIAEINKSDFISFEEFYQNGKNCPEFWTDAPNVVLSINLEHIKKTVRHNHGCEKKGKIFPQELYNLENKIDEIAETKRWIGEGK